MQRLEALTEDTQRLVLSEYAPLPASHLARYGEIDIALDTFPYCGTTTTCEAMWMGVPVITLAGKIHLSRVGVSLLSNVGLNELIAGSTESYLDVATSLASSREKLATLRSGLRERMRASPLCDEPRFTRAFESALRDAWRTWCAATTPTKSI